MGKHSAPRSRPFDRSRPAPIQRSDSAAEPRPAAKHSAPRERPADRSRSARAQRSSAVIEAPQPAAASAAGTARARLPLRHALFAVVTAALIASTLAFASLSKSVKLDVDGKTRTISTYAADVAGVLADSDVTASSRDLVSPAETAPVKDGQTVTVTHARPLTLNIDGTKTVKWVAALTVKEALDQLGLTNHGVSASRSSRIPVNGESLSLTSPKPIVVTADGQTQTVLTTAATVEGAIKNAGIALSDTDQLSVPRDTAVTAGLEVSITRVSVSTITQQRVVPFGTTDQPDPNQYVGIQSVVTAGVNGLANVTVQVQSTNGVQTGSTDISTQVITPPVDAVVSVGAKQFPADVNALNWNALSMCESTNNPKAVNLTNHKYFGLYQFSLATWASVGGSGNPVDASPDEQLARAKMLYMRSGAGQWQCGSHLFD